MRQPRNEPRGKELLRWKLRAGSGHSMGARAPVNLVGSDEATRVMSSLLGTSQEAEEGEERFFSLASQCPASTLHGLRRKSAWDQVWS